MKVVHLVLAFLLLGSPLLAQSPNPVPFINQPLVPDAKAPGGSTFTLTVNGTGFVTGSVVNWNGAKLTTSFVNKSQLTATVPAAEVVSAGMVSVSVTNPTPGGGVSNAAFFDVLAPITTMTYTNVPVPATIDGGSIIAADFNGDGKPDLAYINTAGSNTIVVQLGTGNFNFQPPASYAVGNSSSNGFGTNVIAADFNGDGKLDLAVANTNDNTVSILLGNGDGTFQPQTTFATATSPVALVAGDFNGDGKLDLGVATGGGVSVLLGNGDGTFQSHVDSDTSVSIYGIGTGDFNRDEKLDLVILNSDSVGQVSLSNLPGNGDGTFQPAAKITTFANLRSPRSLTVADLNGDGKLDLAVFGGFCFGCKDDPVAATVLLGNGDGTFQSPVDYPNPFGGTVPAGVVGDFSADGKLDLAYAISQYALGSPARGSLTILPGNGDGTFQSGINFPASGNYVISGLAGGDFNGDGKMDFANSPNGSSIPLFVQGQYPVVSLSATSFATGGIAVGTSTPLGTLTVGNTGTAALTISAVAISGTNANDFSQTNNCIGNLAPSASCQVNLTFAPTEGGNLSATLNISDNDVLGPMQTVSLTGTGLAPATNFSPSSLTFPAQFVGTSGLPQTVTVTNTGSDPLTISKVTTSVADFGTLSNCTNSVPPGMNCTIGVFFQPTASGTRNGTLIITDNAAGSPQSLALTGTGQDFSMAASSSSQTVSPGQTATYSVALTPVGGFNKTVTLTCSGAPAQSTCSLSPPSVALNGSSSASVSVTVTTAGTSASVAYPGAGSPRSSPFSLWLALSALTGLALFRNSGSRRRQLRLLHGLALPVFLCLALAWFACGGGSSGGGGTPAGIYNLTVTGTFASGSTTLTHSAKLTLAVQ